MLDRLRDKDYRENTLYPTCPSLQEDPAALAMLLDQDMIYQYLVPDTLTKVLQAHPAFGEAAEHLAAVFYEPTMKPATEDQSSQAAAAHNQSYSLDAILSDEEDEQPSEEAQRQYQQQAQAARYAAMQRQAAAAAAASRQARPSSGHIITQQMLSNAIASALNSVNRSPQAASAPVAAVAPNPVQAPADQPAAQPPPQPAARNWDREIAQMREMGIEDEALCRHALEATNGDIQAAIDIITGNT